MGRERAETDDGGHALHSDVDADARTQVRYDTGCPTDVSFMGPGTLYGVLSRMNRESLIVSVGEDVWRKNYAIMQNRPHRPFVVLLLL